MTTKQVWRKDLAIQNVKLQWTYQTMTVSSALVFLFMNQYFLNSQFIKVVFNLFKIRFKQAAREWTIQKFRYGLIVLSWSLV
jgi:hypothetical protein